MKKCSIFYGAIFFLGLLGGTAQATHTKFTQPLKLPPVLGLQPNGTYNFSISLEAKDADISVPGLSSSDKTRMWTLSRTGLGTLVGDFPPPTIRVKTGNTTQLTVANNLNDIQGTDPNGTDSSGRFQGLANGTQNGISGDHSEISIHHHGSHVAPVSDGWACGFYIKASGTANRSFTYTYFLQENDAKNNTNNERGTTEWYHNHRVDATGHTVWKGLGGGMFIIDDPADPQLPKGPTVDTTGALFTGSSGQVFAGFKYDVSLAIRDLQFADANIGGTIRHNQIPYTFTFEGSTGDHIMVNGVPQPFFKVEPTKYLFRILVPGNSRKYFLRLQQLGSTTNIAMVQVMQDAGIVSPVSRTIIPIGIAERVGIVIDFGPFAGKTLILQNVQSTRDGGDCVPGNCSTATSEIMQFQVGTTVTQQENINVANITRAVPTPSDLTPVVKRSFRFDRTPAFWVIVREDLDQADRIMDCDRYDSDPVINTAEEWTFRNPGNWTHSIHTHDVDQVCVSRNGASCPASDQFKETWPLAPNTTFVVRLKPTDFTQKDADTPAGGCSSSQPSGDCSNAHLFSTTGGTVPSAPQNDVVSDGATSPVPNVEAAGGRYMLHCHVIEHEDTAMMTQFRVESSPDGTTRTTPCSPPGSCTQ
ncbi:multicopper oxidase family protein [bacterium]|nr:MAG: multicopper oxidase family protein [bacterium]